MSVALAIALLIVPLAGASGETLREILELSANSDGQMVERNLSGSLADEFAKKEGVNRVYARAQMVETLAEPGCGRFSITLYAVSRGVASIKLGEARLDMCEGGLPPVSRQ